MSNRADGRGHSPRRQRRSAIDGAEFFSALLREYSATAIALAAGVSARTVGRWTSGHWCPQSAIERLMAHLWPLNRAAGPVYPPSMAIDGNTRVGGVSEYSRRAARG